MSGVIAGKRLGHGPLPGARPEPWRSFRPLPVRAVGTFLPKLTRAAFEKYGFSAATLVTDWAAIVGRELADFTAPERLKWPRVSACRENPEAEGRPGATLVLRVDPARALDVQYGASRIVERVNGYFGYSAVATLRIVQGPIEREAAPCSRPCLRIADVMSVSDPALAAIRHEGLKVALARLQASLTTVART
jgi:hypothetical protein